MSESGRRPLRVTHVITGLGVGGAERMLVKLLSRLDRDRYRPMVLSLRDRGPLGDDIAALGIDVSAVGLGRGAPGPSEVRRVVDHLGSTAPDIVQTWMYKADLLGGLASLRIGRPPVIWGIRQTELHRRLSTASNRATARACAGLSWFLPARILCVSEEAAEAHRRAGYDGARMVVVPNGFDTARFRPHTSHREALRAELGVGSDVPLVGLVARFDPQKDHECFLRAARRVLDAVPEARFVLCGADVEAGNPTLRAWVDRHDVGDSVHLLGVRRDMDVVTAALDVAVSSSAFGEGFSNALGEAMASGVPCVATDSGNARRLIGGSGRTVPPEDPADLASAMIELLEMPADRRAALGRAARERIVASYEIDEIAREYEQLYEEVVARVRLRRRL